MIHGTAHADVILGSQGADSINGGSGNDRICAGGGGDTIEGGGGSDRIEARSGDDEVTGGNGSDLVLSGPGADTVFGKRGNDRLYGGPGTDDLDSGLGDDSVDGGPADGDQVIGGVGNDHLSGGSGDGDVLEGDYGTDTVDGGPGADDTASYAMGGSGATASGTSNGVHVDLATGTADGDGDDTLSGVEDVVGSPFADTIVGDAEANTLYGGGGIDELLGGGGDDQGFGGSALDRCLEVVVAESCEMDGGRAHDALGEAILLETAKPQPFRPTLEVDLAGPQGALAVAATLKVRPGLAGRHFELLLNMPNPATARSGYELRFTEPSAGTGLYTVTLVRWVSGTPTTLASQANVPLAIGGRFGLVHKAGVLSAWIAGASGEFTQLLSASDTTYQSGYLGIAGGGNFERLANFRGAQLPPF